VFPFIFNQQVVFDLPAILEDGFSHLSSVKASSAGSESQKSNVGASLSGRVLDIVGISLKGDHTKERDSQDQVEILKEKMHTPSSLFSKLRKKLDKDGLIMRLDSIEKIELLESGQFIETHAILKKSSLVDTIEGFKSLNGNRNIISWRRESRKEARKGQEDTIHRKCGPRYFDATN